jgi:hypothetical protein
VEGRERAERISGSCGVVVVVMMMMMMMMVMMMMMMMMMMKMMKMMMTMNDQHTCLGHICRSSSVSILPQTMTHPATFAATPHNCINNY